MSYKFIRTFGTSYTEGGGFHYWINKRVKILYNGLRPMVDNSMFEFSWPYILQQKVKSKVINHALSGHGNDRIFREVYRIVESDDFKTSENLFLFDPVILFAAINILSDASLVEPYKFIGLAALSVETQKYFLAP